MAEAANSPNPLAATQLRSLFRRHGFHPRRQLGQTFLVDANILRKIIEAARLSGAEPVVEIGAGAGAVTRALAERARRVVAIEIDPKLVAILRETVGCRAGPPTPASPNVPETGSGPARQSAEIIQADALAFDWEQLLRSEEKGRWRLVANLPYAITGPAILRLLDLAGWFDLLVIMVQREVAERLLARPGDRTRGLLTVLVEAACAVSAVAGVSRNCFAPRPRVDSTILSLSVRRPPLVCEEMQRVFRQVVKAAFAGRRKMLANSLSQGLGLPKEQTAALLAQASIDPRRRAESLSVEEFLRLATAADTTEIVLT